MPELFLTPPTKKFLPSIPQDKPVYRVLEEKGFFGPDDTLHHEGEIIVLHDDPSINMEPMNEMAKARLKAVIERQTESARQVAQTNGRYFAGNLPSVDDMLGHATEDARRIQSVSNPTGMAIMGAKLDSSKRIEPVGPTETPETGSQYNANKRAKIETVSN